MTTALSVGSTASVLPHAGSCREGVDIQDAYKLLAPALGNKAASILFALALLASGQNSTITGTLAGQVVMEVRPPVAVAFAEGLLLLKSLRHCN